MTFMGYTVDSHDESFVNEYCLSFSDIKTKLLISTAFPLSLQLLRVAHLGTGRRILYKYRRQVYDFMFLCIT